jgi:hypothetical protein
MSTSDPTFEEKTFTQPKSPQSVGMTFHEAANKYCQHDYKINIAIGYPPIYIESDTCQICGMPKDKVKDGE